MQEEIEEFLKKHFPKPYLASEVADVMKISKSSAHRQLKKLLAKGRIAVKDDGYFWTGEEHLPPKEVVDAQVETLAVKTGIPRNLIDEWVEDVKTRRTKESTDESRG